jgi:hypothetical protein
MSSLDGSKETYEYVSHALEQRGKPLQHPVVNVAELASACISSKFSSDRVAGTSMLLVK